MDLREAILTQPMRPFQLRMIALCIVLCMIDGYEVLVMAFVAPHVARAWALGPVEVGYLLSAGIFGMALGATFISPLADRIGRRRHIIACLSLIVVGMGLSAIATDLWQLVGFYLGWIGGGTLLLAGNLAVPYLLRNDGRPRLAMVLVSGGALLNILLNYIMVGRLGLGLTGTAQATLMAEGMVCLLGLGYFFTPYARLRLSWRQLRPSFPAMPNLLFTGLPSLIAQFNLGLLLMLHNSQLMVHGSVKDLAGFTVAGYTEAVFIVVLQGLAFGIQPLVSQAAGARRHRDLKFLMEMGLRITLLYGLAVWLLIQLLPQPVAMLYTGSQDVELLAAAMRQHIDIAALYRIMQDHKELPA